MNQQVMTLRIDSVKKKALDAIAEGTRTRPNLRPQSGYRCLFLEANQWQIAHMKEGLRQAHKKQFASDAQVKSAFARWRK